MRELFMTVAKSIVLDSILPMVTSTISNKFEQRNSEILHKRNLELLDKQARLLKPQNTKTQSENMHVQLESVSLAEFEDLNDYHKAKWDQYFGTIRDLPENASKDEVIHTMQAIEKDIKKYGCLSCRENATKIALPALKVQGKPLTRVMTKDEALVRMCDFKNEVNRHLGKPQFDCSTIS